MDTQNEGQVQIVAGVVVEFVASDIRDSRPKMFPTKEKLFRFAFAGENHVWCKLGAVIKTPNDKFIWALSELGYGYTLEGDLGETLYNIRCSICNKSAGWSTDQDAQFNCCVCAAEIAETY